MEGVSYYRWGSNNSGSGVPLDCEADAHSQGRERRVLVAENPRCDSILNALS